MTRFGIGREFTAISLIYTIIIFILNYFYFSNLLIPLPQILCLSVGIILIIIGVPFFIISARALHKHFNKNKLATKNVYGTVKHPIYASWIILLVPGIVLIHNSFLGLTIPIFMYIIFKILINKEGKYLKKTFGKQYLEYKEKVGMIFPKLF